jgi:hypothetical protein
MEQQKVPVQMVTTARKRVTMNKFIWERKGAEVAPAHV